MRAWIRRPSRIDVPVSVDAVRTIDTLEMVRGTYFVVSSEVPWPDWIPASPSHPEDSSAWSDGEGPPLHLMGSVGVVYGPASRQRRFETPEQMDHIFDLFDRPEEGFSVEIQDIMIPTFWIIGSFQPQDILRIPLEQFHRAYRYRIGLLTTPDLFRDNYEADYGSVETDFDEGVAFRQWAGNQIEEAKRLYADKDQDLKLASRDELPEGWSTDA